MVRIEIISLGIFLLFIYINLWWTQKIYSKSKFIFLSLLSIAIPIIAFVLSENGSKVTAINFGLIIFNYSWLLWTVKKIYKRLNSYLIDKKLIDVGFATKDFTHVQWDGDIATVGDWWDEKRAAKPSWLDQVITLMLFILPISLTIPITYLR
jgi:hypothetical protein